MRGRAEQLLLDQLCKALDRINRRAQFVEQLAQAIGNAVARFRLHRVGSAQDALIAQEAPAVGGKARRGIDLPGSGDGRGTSQVEPPAVNRAALAQRAGAGNVGSSGRARCALAQNEAREHCAERGIGADDAATGVADEADRGQRGRISRVIVVAERKPQVALLGVCAGLGRVAELAELERARLAAAPERLDPTDDCADPVGCSGGGLQNGQLHRLDRWYGPRFAFRRGQADFHDPQAPEHRTDPRSQIAALAQVAAGCKRQFDRQSGPLPVVEPCRADRRRSDHRGLGRQAQDQAGVAQRGGAGADQRRAFIGGKRLLERGQAGQRRFGKLEPGRGAAKQIE